MVAVSMVEFRKKAEAIVQRVQRGEHIVLTRRGKPVVTLQPYRDTRGTAVDDPVYRLHRLAVTGPGMTNEEIDETVYGD